MIKKNVYELITIFQRTAIEFCWCASRAITLVPQEWG